MNTISTLDHNSMQIVGDVFSAAVENVIRSYDGQQSQSVIAGYLTQHLIENRPWLIMTPDGIVNLTQEIFSDDTIRDFVFKVVFQFFSSISPTPDLVQQLAANLAAGCAVGDSVSPTNQNLMPVEIKKRLSGFDFVYDMLKANKWLMVVIMFHLFTFKNFKVKEKTAVRGDAAANGAS